MYAQFYQYSGVKKGEVSLSILSMNASFKNYANTNYPIHLKVEDVASDSRSEAYSSIQELEKCATFYQSGKMFAEIRLKYYSIKMSLFKKMREPEINPIHRFIPIKNFGKRIFMSDRAGGKFECGLNNISLKGINATFGAGAKLVDGAVLDFVLFVESIGFINGQATLRWMSAGAKGIVAGFFITEIQSGIEIQLKDAIKNFTHVNMAREVV
jgi:hypothetical protein